MKSITINFDDEAYATVVRFLHYKKLTGNLYPGGDPTDTLCLLVCGGIEEGLDDITFTDRMLKIK